MIEVMSNVKMTEKVLRKMISMNVIIALGQAVGAEMTLFKTEQVIPMITKKNVRVRAKELQKMTSMNVIIALGQAVGAGMTLFKTEQVIPMITKKNVTDRVKELRKMTNMNAPLTAPGQVVGAETEFADLKILLILQMIVKFAGFAVLIADMIMIMTEME